MEYLQIAAHLLVGVTGTILSLTRLLPLVSDSANKRAVRLAKAKRQ